MQRLTLERHQLWLYLASIGAGLLLGSRRPDVGPLLEAMLWPALVLLLYATFTQTPLLHLNRAFSDHRFITAVLAGNFVLVPALVWLLANWLPDDPVLRLGVLLVLLVPCTDWFITFSHLGEANVPLAIAVTPLNLVLQLLLLPLYLWLMVDTTLGATLSFREVWPALVIIVAPLLLAVVSERWFEARPGRDKVRQQLAWWPVPLLALVVFLIAAAQVGTVHASLGLLPAVAPLFVFYLGFAALIAKGIAHVLKLPVDQARTLAFSLGTRNSFVVLPFALTLPAGWEAAAVVIVTQSLVELFGMVFYLWWIPQKLFVARSG